LYGAETMTIHKNKKRVKFGIGIWKRMENRGLTDWKRNVEVLEMLGEKQSIVKTIKRRKKNWMVT